MTTAIVARPASVPVVVDRPLPRAPWSQALYLGVLAVTVWAPIPFGSVEPWAVGLIRVAAFVLAATWVLGAAVGKRFVVSSSALQIVLFGGAALALAQSIWVGGATSSVDPFASRQMSLTLLAFALLFSLALVSLDRPSRLMRSAMVMLWVAFALSLFAVVQNLSATKAIYWLREPTHGWSFFGPFVNRNHFAGLMEVLLPGALGLLVAGAVPREGRVLVSFAAVGVLVAVVFSESKGGLLSMCAALALLGVLGLVTATESSRPRRLAVGAGGAVARVVCVVVGVNWVGQEKISDPLVKLEDELTATRDTARAGIWRDTRAMIADQPWLGVGLGAYGTAFPAYTRGSGTGIVRQAHSDYLQVVAEAGVVGAVLSILFVVGLGIHLIKGVKRRNPLLRGVAMGAGAGCFGLLVHSIFDFNLQIPSNAVAFLYASALVVAAATIDDSRD